LNRFKLPVAACNSNQTDRARLRSIYLNNHPWENPLIPGMLFKISGFYKLCKPFPTRYEPGADTVGGLPFSKRFLAVKRSFKESAWDILSNLTYLWQELHLLK
jgi:hypothetical protein